MKLQNKELEDSIRQVDAIFALEGLYPNVEKKAIDAALLSGKVTLPQVIDELVAYAKKHKTTSGFTESCSWT